MGIGKRIKELRNESNLTQEELAKKIGVTKSAIANYENGTSHPKESVLYKLFEVFKCDANSLFKDTFNDSFSNETYFEKSDINLIKKYRKLDSYGKKAVDNLLDIELDRVTSQLKHFSESKITDFKEEKKKRELPYYTISASAGNGNFLATNDYILIEVDEYVPQQANYALKVKGDSMEPKYHDGDIVYVKTQKSIENGEIGIFCIDDNVYIKKLEYVDGKYRLISLNPAYKPIEIKESNEFICFGKVLN